MHIIHNYSQRRTNVIYVYKQKRFPFLLLSQFTRWMENVFNVLSVQIIVCFFCEWFFVFTEQKYSAQTHQKKVLFLIKCTFSLSPNSYRPPGYIHKMKPFLLDSKKRLSFLLFTKLSAQSCWFSTHHESCHDVKWEIPFCFCVCVCAILFLLRCW